MGVDDLVESQGHSWVSGYMQVPGQDQPQTTEGYADLKEIMTGCFEQ